MPANLNFEISSVEAGIIRLRAATAGQADPGYSATPNPSDRVSVKFLSCAIKKIVKKNILTTSPSFLRKGHSLHPWPKANNCFFLGLKGQHLRGQHSYEKTN